MGHSKPTKAQKWAGACQGLALALLIGWFIVFSLGRALNIPIFHIDGAYQTASALFHLSEGHFPGRDFQPYLGIAVVYMLFPAYALAGQTLAASQFSSFFMTGITGMASIAVIWQLVFRPKRFMTALLAGGFLSTATLVLCQSLGVLLPYELSFLGEPGVSLRPLRAAAPYLAVALFALCFVRLSNIGLRIGLYGLLTGILLLWSNDFAIPTAGLFGLLVLCHSRWTGYFTWQRALAFVALSVGFWGLFLSITTAGYGLNLLTYNFVNVAKDQWWYFGSYDPVKRIFGLADFYKIFDLRVVLATGVLMAVTLRALWVRQLEAVLLAWLGGVLFLGGVLPAVGGHLGGYHIAFIFWAVVTVFCFLLKGAAALLSRTLKPESPFGFTASVAGLVFALGLTLWQCGLYQAAKAANQADASQMYVNALGGFLPRNYANYIQLAHQKKKSLIVEEYWGILSAASRSFSPWPVDSVIHALGKTRQQAADALDKADLVTTTRYRLSIYWQPWNLSQNYWLYDQLFHHYDVTGISPTTVIWQKRKTPRVFQPVPCSLDTTARTLHLTVPKPGFYRIALDYQLLSNSRRRLLMFQNHISFAPDANGYVSVDPQGKHVVYPVYIGSAQASTLKNLVVQGAQKELVLKKCSASAIPNLPADVLHVPGSDINAFYWYHNGEVYFIEGQHAPPQFYITDQNWVQGVSRDHAGFYLPNTVDAIQRFVTGNQVKLSDGSIRRITKVSKNGLYYNVDLEGPVLDPQKVGLPSSFTVLPQRLASSQ
jgi:hypothetical protein